MTLPMFKERCGYEIDGVWFPRVTSICALANGFAGLKKSDRWGVRFGFQQAALWGTMIHEAVENILMGKQGTFDARIQVSLETFRQWQREYPLRVDNPSLDIERRVIDFEHGYAGTVDIIAKVEGVWSIIDLKTSTNFTKEYGLQTAAYMNAYNKMGSGKQICEKRWILRLDQFKECAGCFARMREKYGRAKIMGGKEICNHRWSEMKGEIEFRELDGYERDLERFFELKERWEWANKEWLVQIPNYEKNIRQYSLL